MAEQDEKKQPRDSAGKPPDPFAQMVQFYDDWTKAWAGAASEMVSNKSFADSLAQQLETTLSVTQVMRRQMGEIMEQSLQQMSVATRNQVASLAERMSGIEMRLDDMEARLDEILDLLKTG